MKRKRAVTTADKWCPQRPKLDKEVRVQHCWHPNGQWWDGMGTSGGNHRVCCYCGRRETQTVAFRPDPQHGGYVDLKVEWPTSSWELRKA